MTNPYNIRPARKDEWPFIYRSFLKNYRRSFPCSIIASRLYFSKFHDIMEYFLENGLALVAVSSDNDDQIFGFVVRHQEALIYVYIKQLYRGMGMGEKLVCEAVDDAPGESVLRVPCYFWTKAASGLQNKLYARGIYLYPDELDVEAVAAAIRSRRESDGLQG